MYGTSYPKGIETRKILLTGDDTEFTGLVPGKSQGRLKGSRDLPHVLIATISFTCQNQQDGKVMLMSAEGGSQVR